MSSPIDNGSQPTLPMIENPTSPTAPPASSTVTPSAIREQRLMETLRQQLAAVYEKNAELETLFKTYVNWMHPIEEQLPQVQSSHPQPQELHTLGQLTDALDIALKALASMTALMTTAMESHEILFNEVFNEAPESFERGSREAHASSREEQEETTNHAHQDES